MFKQSHHMRNDQNILSMLGLFRVYDCNQQPDDPFHDYDPPNESVLTNYLHAYS